VLEKQIKRLEKSGREAVRKELKVVEKAS
jgi:hypothetical protein